MKVGQAEKQVLIVVYSHLWNQHCGNAQRHCNSHSLLQEPFLYIMHLRSIAQLLHMCARTYTAHTPKCTLTFGFSRNWCTCPLLSAITTPWPWGLLTCKQVQAALLLVWVCTNKHAGNGHSFQGCAFETCHTVWCWKHCCNVKGTAMMAKALCVLLWLANLSSVWL